MMPVITPLAKYVKRLSKTYHIFLCARNITHEALDKQIWFLQMSINNININK